MIKFMHNGIELEGNFYRVCYSNEELRGYEINTITIYMTNYSNFPIVEDLQEFQNETDLITGLRVIRVTPDNKYYKEVLEAYNKQHTHNTKTVAKLYENFKC